MSIRPSASILFALVAGLCAGLTTAGEIAWNDNIKQAMNEAASSQKPLFIDAWAIWCVPCKEMDETTYRDPQVVERMQDFVPLKVDQDVQEVFCEKHEIAALPLVLILDGEGRDIARRTGLLTAPVLLDLMQTVEEGYEAYIDARKRPEDPEATKAAASYLMDVGNPEGASSLVRTALKASKTAPAGQREPLELLLAETQLAMEAWNAAAKSFERLFDGATEASVRGAALQGLVRAHLGKGKRADADRTLQRLRADFPDLAAGLTVDSGNP